MMLSDCDKSDTRRVRIQVNAPINESGSLLLPNTIVTRYTRSWLRITLTSMKQWHTEPKPPRLRKREEKIVEIQL